MPGHRSSPETSSPLHRLQTVRRDATVDVSFGRAETADAGVLVPGLDTRVIASGSIARWLTLYIVALTVAELAGALVDPLWGVTAHLALFASVVFSSTRVASNPMLMLTAGLTIAPIIRVTTLSIPASYMDQDLRLIVSGVPVALLAIALGFALKCTRRDIGLTLPRARYLPVVVMLVAAGAGLGYLVHEMMVDSTLSATIESTNVVLAIVGLVLVTGVLEEVLFRGILLAVAVRATGLRNGVLFSSIVYGVMHIGQLSLPLVGLMVLAGIVFGLVTCWTRSLIAPVLAHSAASVVAFVIVPMYLA